jgi:hypothetical protein
MLLWLYPHDSSVCFICFILMLQVFHLDIVKVDLDVAYVAMPIYACCKRIFKCFICSEHMLQIFYMFQK